MRTTAEHQVRSARMPLQLEVVLESPVISPSQEGLELEPELGRFNFFKPD